MFRVVTYNIRAGLGMDGIRSIRRIANVLAALDPDVVCLQEVDQRLPRSWMANQPKFLGVALGMRAVFQRTLGVAGAGFGNCVLVKGEALHCRYHSLPGDGEPRGCVEVRTSLGGREVTVFGTHLSTEERVRVAQAHAVSAITRDIHHPKVLCGDMNHGPGTATLSALLDDPSLRDCALETGAEPIGTYIPTGNRIDFVLADLRLAVRSYQAIDTTASDHRPVVADLDLA